VTYDREQVNKNDIMLWIEGLGYTAQSQDNQSSALTISQAKAALERTEEISTMRWRCALSVIITLPFPSS
jgi:hypothetical protein